MLDSSPVSFATPDAPPPRRRRAPRAALPELARELDARMQARAQAGWAGEAENGFDLLRFRRLGLAAHLGRGSWLDYARRVLDYGRTMAKALCNIAEACERLPRLRTAWLKGEIRWRSARWVARVATPADEEVWLERARCLPEWKLESLATGKLPRQRVSFELTPQQKARLDAQLGAQQRSSGAGDSGQALLELVEGGAASGDGAELRLAPPVQIAIHLCGVCGSATQEGRDGSLPVGPAQLAAARCSAQIVDVREGPARVASAIPPKVRRHVVARDKGRCQVPGCRNVLVDIHHLDGRAGGHDARRMLLLCDAHHRDLHLGKLHVEGEPGSFRFYTVDGLEIVAGPDGGPSTVAPPSREEISEDVRIALETLEVPRGRAVEVVERALQSDPERPWLAEGLFKVAARLWREGPGSHEVAEASEVTDVTPSAAEASEVTDVTPSAAEASEVTDVTPSAAEASEVTDVTPSAAEASEVTDVTPSAAEASEVTDVTPSAAEASEVTDVTPSAARASEVTDVTPSAARASEVTDVTPSAAEASEVTDVTPSAAEASEVTDVTPSAVSGAADSGDRELVVTRVRKALRALQLPGRRAQALIKQVLVEHPSDRPWSESELVGEVLRAS